MCILNGFGRLCNFDAWGEVGSGCNDGDCIAASTSFAASGVEPEVTLSMLVTLRLFVAWVDALGAVAYGEILVVGEAAGLFEDGGRKPLPCSRGRWCFRRSLGRRGEVLAYGSARLDERVEVGAFVGLMSVGTVMMKVLQALRSAGLE